MSSHIITPGPYRATKLWNEVTRLFRAGMPLRKHRQNFRNYSSCFTSTAAVDWLHELLRNNSNFGPDVTRQQTVQLLKKFLKNHVIEDVKGRWGTEDLEDNNVLYKFPSTSPLKPVPSSSAVSSSLKRRPSLREKESFFKFKTMKKHDKESLENVDPTLQVQQNAENHAPDDQKLQRRELTMEDEQEIWRDITLTHLQRILGVASLSEVLDQRCINPRNIIHNMTRVNKRGVVALDDKTNDLPHWVLSAMKSLANWPKYDSEQPSYPGFERDVFKTVSDYFYSLASPLLTYELYELFINVLVFSGHVMAPSKLQRGKRKISSASLVAPPAKSSFRSTECLLLSLIKQGSCDEAESPMREVIGGKLLSRLDASEASGQFSRTGAKARSFSLETILDDSVSIAQQQLFQSPVSVTSSSADKNQGNSSGFACRSRPESGSGQTSAGLLRNDHSECKLGSLRPRSVGSCLDIVTETLEDDVKEIRRPPGRATSCFNLTTPASRLFSSTSSPQNLPLCSFPGSATKDEELSAAAGTIRSRPAPSTAKIRARPASAVVRRCLSSLDVSRPSRPVSLLRPPVCVPGRKLQLPQTKPEHSVLQPHCERVAIEALQLCTLLLPPPSRRKLQLLMRMTSRISQNVDMPRLHPAIGTRTLMVHTFSGCILSSAEECDLDELLATRLVSFLMDHQERIFSVPDYLLNAISDRIQYLRTVQVPVDPAPKADSGDPVSVPIPVYTFCHQISGAEFEEQKLTASQKAMEELLEILLTNQNLSEKERRKKLKQFQKQYPDIYKRRFPDGEDKTDGKPKIKAPLLTIRKSKAFSIRN